MKKKIITIAIVAAAVILTVTVLASKMAKQKNSEITIADNVASKTEQDANVQDDKKEDTKKITELKTGSDKIDLSAFSVGDLVSFGYYPQTLVEDKNKIEELDNLDKDWESYEYYVGDGGYCNGKMESKDFMYFCDLSLKGAKYRAVTFSSYRPSSTDKAFAIGLSTNDKETNESDTSKNGYLVGYVYYFKYEPIVWRVLDPDEGFVVSECIIDCQPFQNYVYSSDDPVLPNSKGYGSSRRSYFASDWSNCSLREWLNEDFYELAFNEKQRDMIAESDISTKSYNEETYTVKREDSEDKIFILSYSEATNSSYGFSSKSDADVSRAFIGTDYAKCQGLTVADQEDDQSISMDSSSWIMRTPAEYMRISFCDDSGKTGDNAWIEVNYCQGICPAMKFTPQEETE